MAPPKKEKANKQTNTNLPIVRIIPAISMHKEYYKKFKSRILNKQKINMHPTVIFTF